MPKICQSEQRGTLLFSASIAVLLFACTGTAHAQALSGWSQRIEVAGAYSFVRPVSSGSGILNLNGASESLGYAFNTRWSAIADAGQYRFSGLGAGLTSTMYTFLAGPRFALKKSGRVTAYAQALAGFGRLNASSSGVSAAENALALAVGGGLDVPFGRRFAVRVIQANYLMTRFENVNDATATQSHIRISAGVVVRLGTRE